MTDPVLMPNPKGTLFPRRYLAAWFPFLPTDRLARTATSPAPHEPFVLVEKIKGALRIASANRAARASGLAPGLALADARARFPGLAAAPADPDADAALLAKLADLAERFTPSVALDPPHGLLLDVTGCAHLLGGEVALRARLCQLFRRLGFATRATIASTPDAARALARFGHVRIAAPGMDAGLVRALPAAALGGDAATTLALARAGLKTVGDVADRPPTALAARFGEGLTRALRRTLGEEDARLVTLRPVPDCVAEHAFAEPLTHADGIEAVLGALIVEVSRLLAGQDAGGRAFEASFFRSDGAVRRVTVETGQPSREPQAILRLFHERLDVIADPLDPGFGFDLMRLAVPVAEPLAPAQPSLDGQQRDEMAIGELVDRLVARLGRDRVLRFVARDTHDPAREAAHVRIGTADRAGPGWQTPGPSEPPSRPLRLFARPQLVDTLAEVPDGPPRRFRWRRRLHEIARAEGPERIAPEWWRVGADAPTRDYYRVEDRAGRRFWLFREGLYGEAQTPRWYMHGLFA